MTDDPNFFHQSQHPNSFPRPPMWVTGFAFDPATRTFDFSAVPGFDLSRLQYIRHLRTSTTLYGRPNAAPYGLAEIDGVAVPPPPMAGKLLKVCVDCSGMLAGDEILAVYDPPAAA